MVTHSWTYQSLVHDVMDLKLNRVTFNVRRQQFVWLRSRSNMHTQVTEGARTQKKSYDLDTKDFFWASNAAKPFPQVAEDIDTELGR